MGKENIWLQLREAVLAIDDAWLRTFLFGQFGQLWPEAGERIFWEDALAALEQVYDEGERTTLLIRFAPYLPRTLHENVACLIAQVTEKQNRTRLLLAFAPFLPLKEKGKYLVEVLETLVEMPTSPETLEQLGRLVPFLSELERMGAVGMIQEQPGLWGQTQKIRPFLPYLRVQDRQTVVSQIIFRCRRLEPDEKYRVMAEVAPFLPEPKLRELIDGFRELTDDMARSVVLERTAEVIPEAQMGWIWDGIQSIWNQKRRLGLICRLYNWLPSNRQPLALAEIRNTLKISPEREELLLSIRDEVPYVLILEVLELAAEVKESVRVEILDKLLTRMAGEMLAEGLEMAIDVGQTDLRYKRLEMIDRLGDRLVAWAKESPSEARLTWQMLFAKRKGRTANRGNGNGYHLAASDSADDGLAEAVTAGAARLAVGGSAVSEAVPVQSAHSRAELLVNLVGLLPFFLHFVPANHRPGVTVGLVEELRRFVTGPKMLLERRKLEQQIIS